MVKKITLFLFCAVFFCSILEAGENNVRVLLLNDVKEFTLTIKGNYEISVPQTKTLIYKGKNISKEKVSCSDFGIIIGKLRINNLAVEIKPQKSSYIYVNNRRYRGTLRIMKSQGLKLKAINNLDIEDYLKGVLRQEVSFRWPMNVLMAQAIAARTYVLYQKELNKAKDFDVTCDVYSQMYGGVNSETWRTNNAVGKTKGKVLTFQEMVFPAYYHATCSGHTEDANVLWNIDMAPLKGNVCNFCKESPHFKWTREIALSDIESKLKDSQFSVKKIQNILIEDRDNSGRIVQLKIIDYDGAKLMPAKDFRQLLGPDVIRSANFYIQILGGKATFKGLGWGHGVGLCQWGAYKMAMLGYLFDEILEFYYPGSKIKKIY